jgi:release factor glutamine methyltransferase
MNKFELVIHHDMEVSEEQINEFEIGLEKIKNNTPIQYITNHQEFMKLDFYVDENVLIPQPDTEILVEEVIKHVSKNAEKYSNSSPIKILDLCTGSGAIAISLAKYIENAEITATDISTKAIQIAKLNAEKNLVHTKIKFIESDMFKNINENQFDIIVSNPPYIETEVINILDKEVQKEPHLALDGGADGLKFYRLIIKNAKNHLSPNGKIFLEIGYNQKDAIFQLIQTNQYFKNPVCIKDLAGNDRVVEIES